MNFYFLGTCSGTEPYPDTHHCATLLECGGQYYWFDCGEGAAHTAHNLGLDLLKSRALFVSHPHPDHTCGIPHLLFVLSKLAGRRKEPLVHENTLTVFFPGLNTFQGAKILCFTDEKRGTKRFLFDEHEMHQGLLYQDENVTVTTVPNCHMKETEETGFHAFSFLIEAEGKRVVLSGDVWDSSELLPLIKDGCDLLIHETGHHPVEKVCRFAAENGVGRLFFHHHGREILNGREEAEALVRAIQQETSLPIRILSDKESFTL